LLITTTIQSQKKTFVRIFDLEGKKTHTGFLAQTSDSSIILLSNKSTIEVPIDQIGVIKLRRSIGHTILVSTLIGAGSLAILGAATADPDAWIFGYTVGEGVAAGLLVGGMAGAGIGGIIGGTLRRPIFTIAGKQINWEAAKKTLQLYVSLLPKQ